MVLTPTRQGLSRVRKQAQLANPQLSREPYLQHSVLRNCSVRFLAFVLFEVGSRTPKCSCLSPVTPRSQVCATTTGSYEHVSVIPNYFTACVVTCTVRVRHSLKNASLGNSAVQAKPNSYNTDQSPGLTADAR